MASNKFTGWRKATYSHANSDCVEVATARRAVSVRDAKQAGRGQVLQFTPTAWRAFIADAKRGNA